MPDRKSVLGPDVYQRAVEAAPNAIVMVDKEGKIILVNNQTEKLFGYSREELLNQKIEKLFPKRFRTKENPTYISGFFLKPKTQPLGAGRNLFGLKKNRDEIPIEIGLNPITTSEGTFVLASIIDITERKRAEKRIQAAKAYAEDIVATVREPLIVLKADLRVVSANRSFYATFRISPEETEGRLIYDLGNRQWNIPKLRELLEKILPRQTIFQDFEVQHNFETIGQKTMLLNARKIVQEEEEEEEEEELILLAIEDITVRKKLEQEISDRNRELETLLHVTSHDLKEPLRAIENFSEMIAQEHTAGLDPEGKDLFHRVTKASQRLGRLLDDILALTRARRLEKPAVSIDGQTVVNEALSRLEEKIRETGATVRLVGKFPTLYADKTWAVEAVYNLVSNALKFKKDGVPPEVEIASYHPQARPNLWVAKGQPREVGGQAGDPPGVGFVVRDRGPGVAPEHTEMIFELFKRAAGREVEGTGAGLAIVWEVARRHGGKAWVRPREGGGSEFNITFGG